MSYAGAGFARDGSRALEMLRLRESGMSWKQVGERMGVTWSRAKNAATIAYRRRAQLEARMAAYAAKAPALATSRPPTLHPDPEDAATAMPGCPRCGLRDVPLRGKVEPHECLPTSAAAYLGRREEAW